MNKNTKQNTQTISDLVSDLPEENLSFISLSSNSPLSNEKIRKLSMEKRRHYMAIDMEESMEKRSTVSQKKKWTKFLAIAAIVATLCMTAFAFNQTDLMKSLFGGKNKNLIDTSIMLPIETGEADGKKMTIQSVLTDGYITNIVVSVENADNIDPYDHNVFEVTSDNQVGSKIEKMENFSQGTYQYFHVSVTTSSSIINSNLTISLNSSIAPITLTTKVVSSLDSKTITFPENTTQGTSALKELQISPVGYLLTAYQSDPQKGLPSTNITLVFNDGHTEEIDAYLMDSDPEDNAYEMGGGFAVIEPDLENGPLMKGGVGSYNYENSKISVGGEFSRLIDTSELKEIIIDGISYPVKR